MLGAKARPGWSPGHVLQGQTQPADPGKCLSPGSAETPGPGHCPLWCGEGSIPWVRAGGAACGCSVPPWDIWAGWDMGLHARTSPVGCTHPAPRLRVLPAAPPGFSTPVVPVSQRACSWGRRGHGRCRDRPAASPPLAPTPGAGAARLQAGTCLTVITGEVRTSEDLHSSLATPGKTFTISQFLRNNFPPAQPSCSPARGAWQAQGMGDRGRGLPSAPSQFVLGAAGSPVPSPAAPGAAAGSGEGWCLRSLCGVQCSSVP